MMANHTVKMPDLGEGITEVEVVAWHVQAGDTVAEDQVLADVMTDKATVEIPSPVAGRVHRLGGEVGEVLAVGAALIEIAVDATAAPHAAAAAPKRPEAPPDAADNRAGPAGGLASTGADANGAAAVSRTAVSAPAHASSGDAAASAHASSNDAAAPAHASSNDAAAPAHASPESAAARAAAAPAGDDKPIASPALRRRAWELGVDLRQVQPSGVGGRIMQADLDAHVARHGAASPGRAPQAPDAPVRSGVDETQKIKVIGLRRRIAQKMQESKRRIPHFAYVEECDVTELESLRAQLNGRFGDSRGKLTLLPFLVRAMVLAIVDIPQVNALFDDETGLITRHGAVHMGIATQTDAGLMVPVLRHAQDGDLWANARAIGRLAEMTRSGRATRGELTGSTITLTSLGALGGIVSTPIINAPEVAIVGVNRIVDRPMLVGGAVVGRKMMNLSSSFDHRVVDGQDAARFIQAVRGLLEAPGALLAA
jgi:2-oxoisovalerate dehydrogenase E2 component (dihydrolipoyl transacylase)